MEKPNILGIILVFFGLLILVGFLIFSFWKKEESPAKQPEKQQIEISTKEEINTENINRIEEIDLQNEAGTDDDRALIEAMDCNISSMCDEIKNEISDMGAFEYAIKEYLYLNGFPEVDVYSLDTLTVKYKENKKYYLMGLVDENSFFYVVYDIETDVYSTQEY